LIACAIVEAPDDPANSWFYEGGYEGFRRDPSYFSYYQSAHWSQWIMAQRGFMLNTRRLIEKYDPKIFVAIIGGPRDRGLLGKALKELISTDAVYANCLPDFFASDDVRIKGLFKAATEGAIRPKTIATSEFTMYIPTCVIERIRRLHPGKAVKRLLEKLSDETSTAGWKAYPGGGLDGGVLKSITTLPIDAENPAIICAYNIAAEEPKPDESILADQWMQVLGTTLVPYDISEREVLRAVVRKKLPDLLKIREQIRNDATTKSSDQEDDDLVETIVSEPD